MLKKFGAAALLTAAQSFAIVGFGGHYVINTATVDAAKSTVYSSDEAGVDMTLDQKKVDGLSGAGVKFWIDVLPFVDIEATGNMQFSRYSANLTVSQDDGTTQNVPIELEFDNVPFLNKARPVFASMTGDLSVTYPFDMLPIVRPYVGGGVSFVASTPVMSKKFTENFLKSAAPALLASTASGEITDEAADQLGTALGEALAEEGLNTGIAGHALVGLRIKPPVIPLAVYANAKYYVGGNFDSQYNPGFVFELGGGFAL